MIIRAKRRDVLRYGAASMLAALSAPAIADTWPSKPIRIICTYPAGGLTDVFARAYGDYIAQKTGQPVLVENRTGAAGAIGAEMVKQAAPDGYTLMFTNSTTMVQNKALFKKLPYDPDKDFALVAWFNTGHLPTIVNKDVPATNIKEFAAWAQGRKVSLATYGIGSFAHVVTETLNRHYGLKMEAVHYRGESLMWQDVASGAVQGATGSYASASSVLQTGSGRPIAVPTMERMKRLPDVPTFYEQGLTEKAFQIRGWVGCAAPAGTPEQIVQKLSDLMVEAGKTERVQKVNDTFAIDEGARDRTYFKKVLDEEGPVSIEIIKSLNIDPQ
ncbi:Bug family tripartite tricarboxylate transporter substrate binding protein [Reyranella massiliensis]|uniref:Bug family tripartite tricarboxylate transporter substrate binding protein n=1 Tax=Reyranella massiliensis TaxID=445220 RepID=UPI0002E64DB9|nr:tripartite tricarboxylate transporter substrate binding protein [Reyranella massiliensis]